MGNPLFYLCPILRPCFSCKFWDPNRKTSKLRNDAIKKRIDNRYAAASETAAPVKAVKHIPPKPQPRVEEKQDAREERKAKRREERSKGRTARAARGITEKHAKKKKKAPRFCPAGCFFFQLPEDARRPLPLSASREWISDKRG
jgi:hypothetical protein